MKLPFAALLTLTIALAAPAAHARRDIQAWPIADVMNNPEYMAQLNGVSFKWGDIVSGQVLATSQVERATEGIFKKDKAACEWALLAALKQMRLHALENGADKVEGVKSTITGAPYASADQYLCMTGATNSRVAITGSIVRQVSAPAPSAPPANPQSSTPQPLRQPRYSPAQTPDVNAEPLTDYFGNPIPQYEDTPIPDTYSDY